MNCVQFDTTGSPTDVIHVRSVEPPPLKRGSVRVRMLASPVNPSDLMFIQGTYGRRPVLPQIPGFEGVGIVRESAGGFRGRMFLGKRVAVLNAAGGNWAEEAVVPASQVIPISRQLSIEQAATFFVNPATAWILTQEVLKVPRQGWLLQTAAGSSLGQMVVRLGRRFGFRTLNVVRRESDREKLLQLGADRVIVFDGDTQNPDVLVESVAREIGDGGLQHAIDPVGGVTGSCLVRCLSSGGRLVVFGTLSEGPLLFGSRELITRQASIEGFWLGNFMKTRSLPFKLRLMKRITRLILDGTLSTSIGATFPVEQAQAAIAHAQSPDRNGKTILSMSPDEAHS